MAVAPNDALLINAVDGEVCLTFKNRVVMVLSLTDLQVKAGTFEVPEVKARFLGRAPEGVSQTLEPQG